LAADYTEPRAENEGKMEIIVEKNEREVGNYGEHFSHNFQSIRRFIKNVALFPPPELSPLAPGEWTLARRA
jgi:hypothetical protein